MFSLIQQANFLHMEDNTQGWRLPHKDILTRKVSWEALALMGGQCHPIIWTLPATVPAHTMGSLHITVALHGCLTLLVVMDPTA